jgi:penicillin amidase
VVSLRAAELVPVLLSRVEGSARSDAAILCDVLRSWDSRFVVDSPAPTVWIAFWERWLRRVAAERFPEHLVGLAATQAGAVARLALLGDPAGQRWFEQRPIDLTLRTTLQETLTWLAEQFGPSPEDWLWGRTHTVTWEHALATHGPAEMREPAAALFNVGPFATSGGPTVRAAGFSTAHPFRVTGGATYRLVADLSPGGSTFATTTTGQSGHPGSPHYADQVPLWLEDSYHPLAFDGFEPEAITRLEPA